MAQVEPYRVHTFQSEVAGIVVKSAIEYEFSYISKRKEIVQLDTSSEDISIKYLKSRISKLNEIITTQKSNYSSKAKVRQISKYELNREKLGYLNSEVSLLNYKNELESKKLIKRKKRFYAEKCYLGRIYVDTNEFVGMGSKIFDCYDISKLKIEIFVDRDEVQNIQDKKVYINNKLSEDWKVEKVSKIQDTQHLSSYLVRLVKQNEVNESNLFGKVVKIEFK
jgi:hypothetical protein